MMLSPRQKEELNRAIADYLMANNYKDTFESFIKETSLPINDISVDKKYSGVLEKNGLLLFVYKRK